MARKSSPAKAQAPADSAFIVKRLTPDRDLAEPVYLQMVHRVTRMLEANELGAGQSLPSERTLAERLGISRTTVRRFLEELKSRNLLVSQGRSGPTLMAPPRISPRLGMLKGFTEEMRELGMTPTTRLLERAIVQDRSIASIFARPSTASFLRLVRLRLGDDVPLSREVAWYDLTLAPELATWDAAGSAYQLLRDRCGIRLASADQSVEAVFSSPPETEAFGFETPQPCLLMKRRTYAGSGQVVEYVEGTFRGDSYAYRLKLEG